VELFNFVRVMLAVIVTISVLPVNVPLAALAFRVYLGQNPLPFPAGVLWLRSFLVGVGVFVLGLALAVLDYLVITELDLPAGPVHLTLLMLYLPVAVWLFFWLFALEDLLQALGVFTLFVFLPGFPLLLIDRVLGFWHPLDYALEWLPKVPVT
jgi:hypothetical protein